MVIFAGRKILVFWKDYSENYITQSFPQKCQNLWKRENSFYSIKWRFTAQSSD